MGRKRVLTDEERLEHRREALRLSQKKYRETEAGKQYMKEYREKNRERYNEYTREYMKKYRLKKKMEAEKNITTENNG